jgi:uncharacterized membrane protein YkvI
MQNLLSLNFWFELYPPALTPWTIRIMLVIFVALLLVGIVGKIYSIKTKLEKWTRRTVDKASSMLITMGVLGLMIFFFGYEQIPILSMKFGYIIWIVLLGIWLYFLYNFIFNEIPRQRKLKQEREHVDKWLPKPKKS